MTVMSAFDIPIHTKNISTRDFAMRTESDAPVSRKERPAPVHVTAALVASCMTVWYALQQTLTDGLHLASCLHFYVAAVLPMLLYDHILAPSRSKNMWVLLILHVGSMLFAYPYDREYVSFRLHVLLLGLALVLTYKHTPPAHSSHYLLAVASSVNSAVSLCIHTQHAEVSSLYYHASFVLLFASLVLMLYAV
jgi:hypothetical protein